jgi:hypothetical protein
VALVTIGVGSVVWGLFLVFSVAARERINGLTTAHLLAMLALLVIPGATWLAWRFDRRAHGSKPVPSAPAGHDAAASARHIHGGPKREAAAAHRPNVAVAAGRASRRSRGQKGGG